MSLSRTQNRRANERINRSLVFCLFGLTGNLMNPDNLVLRFIVAVVAFWTVFFAVGKILAFLFT